ncbi:MAG: efflux RND transporter permease subunit [Bacteroidales bacterium]|nr:efflux RND transporter permease subunit [Bacteroidales bacterium]MBN2758063.1 efflux RND transporter permease subunit [Bacteroidales bacterium]
MKEFVKNFIKFPFYANIIVVIIIIAGGIALKNTKKSFFPERKSRFITVSVSYPGASPKEMEEGITSRIEEAVRGIVGIKEITSNSMENFANISVETTGKYDLDMTLLEVKNAVDAINSFPTAAEKPIVTKQRTTTNAMMVGLSGDVDMETLKKYGQEIEEDFLATGYISQVSVSGYPALEISVETKEEDLLRYNLTFDEISNAIALNNQDISAGIVRSSKEELYIRSRARSVDPDEIGEIIIRANPDGGFLRIRDVAVVKKKFADVANYLTMNGKQAVWINIQKLAEEDLDKIANFTNDYVNIFNKGHKDVQLFVVFDFLQILGQRLNLLYRNGGMGLLLVIITLALFLSFRLSMWVAWGIPSAFLGMFIVAPFFGITINMISLFGMILVVGILVDDGIVIAENIFTHFEKGKSPIRAAIDGTNEVLIPVITSALTTMIAFSPLLLLEGAFEFLYEMAFVVIFSIAFSLLEAFFVLPTHIGSPHILRAKSKQAKIRIFLEKGIDFLKFKIYGKILEKVIKWKWIALSVPTGIIILTIGLFDGGLIKTTFFPNIPFDSFNVEVAFKPGEGEAQTRKYLKQFEEAIWEVDKQLMKENNDSSYIKAVFRFTGTAFSGKENGSHAGTVMVFMRDMEKAPISSFDIANSVREKIGEVKGAEKFSIGGRNRFGSPVSISLLGKNLEELKQAKKMLEDQMKNMPELINITDNDAAGMPEILLNLKPKAYFLGLNHAFISNQVRQGFFGGQAQRIQNGRDELRIWVRFPKENRQTVGQLEKMKIKTPQGEYYLSELADFEIKRGPVNIQRYNGSREVRVDADTKDPYAAVPPILEHINSNIIPQIKTSFPGIRIKYQGQQKDSEEATSEIILYFGTAFAIILLIIMIQFKSATHGLIIIMLIPLAWLGAAWGHGIEGIPVSMLSAWGMVALAGVIVNDSIVMLDKYNLNLLEGQTVEKAIFNAGISRFRPIILTTFTTAVGLYPIIFEKSFQAQFLKPMAVSLAYGVLFGTAFILVFFPVLILVRTSIKVYIKWLWTGERPTNESMETILKDNKRLEEQYK